MNPANRTPSSTDAQKTAANRATIPPESSKPRNRETVLPTKQDSIPNAGEFAKKPGREFGRYEILECLGQGAMGEVYKARDRQLDRIVALKIPKFSAEAAPELLERFHREARSAATLSHPNICPVFDVGEHGGTHYISMGYIDGNPLSAFIKPGKPQPERKAAGVVRKLAQGLEEAHRQGVVHRDLKPDNVMIDQRGQPIIMDFGLAQQSKANNDIRTTHGGQMIGTPAYMSPEQVDGDLEHIGPASDVYSLGVMLYELLTGELPYQGSVASVLAQIIKGEPVPPGQRRSGLDGDLEAICLKMMAADRKKRYQSMSEVTGALTAWLKGESSKTTTSQSAATREPEDELEALFHATRENAMPVRAPARSLPPRPPAVRLTKEPRGRASNKPWFGRPWVLIAGGGLACVLLLLGVVLFVQVGDQTVKIEIDDPDAQVFIDGENVAIKNLGATVELKPGEHNLHVRRGDIVVQTDEFEVFKGKNPVLKIQVVKPPAEKPQVARTDLPRPAPQVARTDSPQPPATSPKPVPEPAPKAPTPMAKEKSAEQAARFEDGGDYVLDNQTGLLWQKDGDASGKRNFSQAAEYAKSLKLEGLTGWRVPTAEELAGIFPATESPFKDSKYTKVKCCEGPYEWDSYWTSRIQAANAAHCYSWYADGGASSCYASNLFYVRCVHDPIDPKFNADKDPTRQLVEWTLQRGGRVLIRTLPLNQSSWLFQTSQMPAKFEVVALTWPPKTEVSIQQLEWVSQLKTLVSADMQDCGLTDEGLRLIAQNNGLTELRIRSNAFTDAGLEHLQHLESLKMLWLEGAQISDAGLKNLAGLSHLEWLDVSETRITDKGIEPLLQLDALKNLDLDGAKVTDSAVRELKALPSLEYLYLRETGITDEALKALAGHKTLRILMVANTGVTDAGLAYLKGMPRLEVLMLDKCHITDDGVIKYLTKLKNLRGLGLAGTKLTDRGLDALIKIPNLRMPETANTAVTSAAVARFEKAHPKPMPPGRPRPPRRPSNSSSR